MITLPTCEDLPYGAPRTVAGVVFSHHCDIVSQATLQILYNAVMLICRAEAGLTFAAHYGGAEPYEVACRLPGNVQDTRQTVKVVLYVLWDTRSWGESKNIIL